MRKTTFMALLLAGLMATTTFADSNGTPSEIINTGTTVNLGGPFDHSDAAGDPTNSTTSAIFSESFTANQILIEGDITGVQVFNGQYFFNEADIVVTDAGGTTVVWQNPLGAVPDTTGTLSYSAVADLATAGGSGTFGFEFIDTFDDGAGADSVSTNVTATLLELSEAMDETGNWSIDEFGGFGVENSVGEFLVAGVFDTYTIDFAAGVTPGLLSITTDEDANGVSGGDTVDTEMGLFDSTGVMVAYSDDEGNGLYSFIDSWAVNPGESYTLAISGFGSNMAAGGVGSLLLGDVTGGTSTGDYKLNVTFVPEPSALSLLAIVGLVGVARRRR